MCTIIKRKQVKFAMSAIFHPKEKGGRGIDLVSLRAYYVQDTDLVLLNPHKFGR